MKKTLLFVGLLMAAAFTSHVWAVYEPITDKENPKWITGFTFISGLWNENQKAVWVSTDEWNGLEIDAEKGKTFSKKQRPAEEGTTYTMKFAKGYRHIVTDNHGDPVDTVYFDLYVNVTPSETSDGNWQGKVEAKDGNMFVRIMPKDAELKVFDFEAWLQNEGTGTLAKEQFIAGNCFVANSEYIRIFGNQKVIYTNNIPGDLAYVTTTSGKSGTKTWNGWHSTNDRANKSNKYLIGSGYTDEHHVKMAYGATNGMAEFVIGYLAFGDTIYTPDGIITGTFNMGDTISLCELTPGYKGWVVLSDSVILVDQSIIYKNGIITQENCSIISSGELKLQVYAPYNITLDPNGTDATVDPTTKQVELGAKYPDLPTPVRDGYNFEGWFTDPTGGTQVTTDTDVLLTTTHTLYAHWTEAKPKPQVTDGTGMTLKDAQKQIKDSLKSWFDQSQGSNKITVKIVRTIYKDTYYNTLCLPFDATAAQIEDAFKDEPKELKKFKQAQVVEGEIQIELEDASEIEAGQAYFISFNTGTDLPYFIFKDVQVTDTIPDDQTGDMIYQGVLAPVQLDAVENLLFLSDKNTLYWPTNDGTFLRGFRAYFNVENEVGGKAIKRGMKASFSKGIATGKADVVSSEQIKKMVKEGRVVLIKDGVKYDLLGNVIK